MELPIVIIGPGRVGTALGIMAARHGYPVAAVGARRSQAARNAAAMIDGSPKACSISSAAREGRLILLTVSDDAIGNVATELADGKALRRDAAVVHLSGALSSSILSDLRRLGCSVASAHPMQTFAGTESAIEALEGCYWFCEGDPPALAAVSGLITALGGHVVDIATDRKVDYHLAAVFACNYLVVLMDVALLIAERAGIDRKTAWAAFYPMVNRTLSNIGSTGAGAALTGPIRRGDRATVERHLAALRNHGELVGDLYRILGRWAVKLCREQGHLDDGLVEQIMTQLSAHLINPNRET